MYFNFLLPQSYSSATSKLLAVVKIMIYTQKSSIISSDYHKTIFSSEKQNGEDKPTMKKFGEAKVVAGRIKKKRRRKRDSEA